MPKISIIMPTYNDANTITQTFDSILIQNYLDWELIIVDDGSTDNTKETISTYIKDHHLVNKFQYFYQKNADQLNALLNGLTHVTGDYIYILHSDDLLADENVFTNAMQYFKDNETDCLISDLITINEDSKITGKIKVSKYRKTKNIPVLQLLWLGRNLYVDVAFWKRSVFENEVKNNYLIWNTPFWLNADNKVSMLNVKKVSFPFLRYRVYGNNYINNEIGKLNVVNGELRTAIKLFPFYNIPLFKIQYLLFRLLNKCNIQYKVFFNNKPFIKKADYIDFLLRKRFGDEFKNNIFLNSLHSFYNNSNKRTIKLDKIDKGEFIYNGADVRLFNKNLLGDKLSSLYKMIINEMMIGFDEIIVNKNDIDKIKIILKFLCIDKEVVVRSE